MEPWLSGFTFAVIHHNNRNEQIESPPIITHAIGHHTLHRHDRHDHRPDSFSDFGPLGWTKKFQGLPRKLQAWVLLRGANPSIQMFGCDMGTLDLFGAFLPRYFGEALCLGFT